MGRKTKDTGTHPYEGNFTSEEEKAIGAYLRDHPYTWTIEELQERLPRKHSLRSLVNYLHRLCSDEQIRLHTKRNAVQLARAEQEHMLALTNSQRTAQERQREENALNFIRDNASKYAPDHPVWVRELGVSYTARRIEGCCNQLHVTPAPGSDRPDILQRRFHLQGAVTLDDVLESQPRWHEGGEGKPIAWTGELVSFLQANYKEHPAADRMWMEIFGSMLSEPALKSAAMRYGCDGESHAGARRKWTKERDRILAQNYAQLSAMSPQWEELLGVKVTPAALRTRAKELGVAKPRHHVMPVSQPVEGIEPSEEPSQPVHEYAEPEPMKMQEPPHVEAEWTEEEDAAIRELWPSTGVDEAAWDGFFPVPAHCTVMDVWKRARQLGLPTPPLGGASGEREPGAEKEPEPVPDPAPEPEPEPERPAEPEPSPAVPGTPTIMDVANMLNALKGSVASMNVSIDFGNGMRIELES